MKIGMVVADELEFSPLEKICEEFDGGFFDILGDKALRFNLQNGSEVAAVLCGVGKVNAAGAASALICEEKPDCVINFGLAGALSGVNRGDVAVGTKYIEYDFDLTALGRELGEKPGGVRYLLPDSSLFEAVESSEWGAVPCVFVCGDTFVSCSEKKDFLVKTLDANCCDMESVAVAGVCFKAKIPFLSLKLISDDADENAKSDYKETNILEKDTLIRLIMDIFG